MSITGGSYMSQLCTNSVAMKRCMTMSSAPLSSHVNVKEPYPPYAVNYGKNSGSSLIKPRPYSAPHVIRSNGPVPPQRQMPYHDPRTSQYHLHQSLYHRPHETPVSRSAPFAARRIEAFIDTALNQGSRIPYDALNDPHLVDYYERKFGALDIAMYRRSSMSGLRMQVPRRSQSARYGRANNIRSGVIGEGKVLYKVSVTTGDRKNAGSDAKVWVTLKGTKAKLNKTRLMKKAGSVKSAKDVGFKFSRGTTHIFKVRGPELGDLRSILIETSAKTQAEAWHLQEVEVINTKTKKSWLFLCNQWFSLFHSDQQTHRELFPEKASKTEYEIVTVTGDCQAAGTDANVFLTIFGKTGVTPKIHLKNSHRKCFRRGTSDVFMVKAKSVGPMTKVRIEHDNTGFGAGWYLERVVVTDLRSPRWKYFFPCGQWLAKDEGDGAICRDLAGSKDPLAMRKVTKYKVTVYTADKRGAGTDANVYVTLFGEKGESGEKRLDTARKNNFERGQVDEFYVESPGLGRLERIRIGHDNSGFSAGWLLDKVIIDDMDMGTVYDFPCNRWLASDEDDGMISRELLVNVGATEAPPGVPYTITVVTGDVRHGGTDSRVYVILYGGKGGEQNSGKIWLEGGKFERAKTDKFNVEVTKLLSPLSRIDVGHNNKGAAAGWFLEKVTVNCPSAGLEQAFPCSKWLALDEGDGVIQRTLYEQKAHRKKREKLITWYTWVYTSDIKGAGTDANVFLVAYGEKGKSDDIPLRNKTDNFESGNMDAFKFEMTDIGKPYKIRVWHDDKGLASGWHLNKVVMENMATKERYSFPCGRWLATDEDDHNIVRELPAEGPGINKPLPMVHYNVEVHTGKKSGAGTDANVFLNIFGDLGDTGDRDMRESKSNRNKFEKGNVDVFDIEAVTLKKLKKIKIGHDGKRAGDGWFLDKVVIKQEGSSKYDTVFECNRWLSTDEDDGAIVREITAGGSQMLSTTSYHVGVKTGDVRGGATDANVFIKIFGTDGDTGALKLRSAENTSNKFERARRDMFKLEATDIGKVKKIKIGHDGVSPGAGWFLDEVTIDIPSRGEHYLFACHRWLARDEDDGQIELELEPSTVEERDKTIPYEVTVWTGDLKGAGTDANVFIQMYGDKGKTEELKLRNRTDNFEKGNMDKFKIEAANVGNLQKVRIGHDGKGLLAGWFLDKFLIQRPKAQVDKRRKISLAPDSRRKSLTPEMRRKSILESADFSDEDSDSTSSPGRRRRRSPRALRDDDSDSGRRSLSAKRRSLLKTVTEEQEDGTDDYWFFVNSWFARSEGDGLIIREVIPTDKNGRPLKGTLEENEYMVKVYTGDKWGAGTDANIFVNIFGKKGDTGERQLKESNNMNKFERKQEDIFIVKAIDLHTLTKLKIRHDNKGGGAAWFLDRVEIEDTKRKRSYFFPCQRWLAVDEDDGQITRELVPVDESLRKKLAGKDTTSIRDEIALETKAAMTTYHAKVTTGKKWGAGTDANVYVILYGEEDNTGQMFLKSSLTNKNKFESGQTDEFILEAVDIGDLKKIRIGHDNAGGGAAWYLDKVVIDAPSLGKAWTFPCSRWLSKKEDDGLIERELYPQDLATEVYGRCVPYEVTTYTSDISGASTDADVYIVLYGRDGCTMQKSLCSSKRERKDKFKRGAVDKFIVEVEDIGDNIEKIRIGHDASGFGSGWHCSRVEVRKLLETGRGSVTFTFPCDRWLAKDEEDGAIVRELVPEKITEERMGKDGQVKTKERRKKDSLIAKKYQVNVYTGDVKGAGTDANVFLTVYGDKGDSGERKLSKSETHRDKFERGQVDKFTMDAVDLGNIHKIHIRHDNAMINPSWFLDKVEVVDTMDNDVTVFHCERWLAKNKDDGKIERSFYIKGYDGDMSSQGTLRSGRIGSVSSLDSMRSDAFGKSPRLSKKQLSLEQLPEGPTIPYTVKVITGDGGDNGTNSNVWIKLFGPKKKNSGKLYLELAQREGFEPGSVETFSLEALEMDEIRQIELGHDGVTPGTGWFVKEAEVDIPTKGKHYHFTCKTWLARDKGDGKTSRVFTVEDGASTMFSYRPMVQYEVTVYTGDVDQAGTDCPIFMTVFGTKGSSSVINLDKNGDRFERGRSDLIKLELDDISPLRKLRIWHDGKGSRPDWYLEKVDFRNMDTGDLTVFKCNKWFSRKKAEDGKLMRDLPAFVRGKAVVGLTSYKVKVKTSAIRGAGTDANVFINMFGENGNTGDLHLKDSETNKSAFDNDQLDEFTIANILSVGELSKLRVWHDNKGFGAAWHLSYIEVTDMNTRKKHTFPCDKWLSTREDDKQIVRELTCADRNSADSPARDRERVTYEIEVITTDKKEGGTMHNGWLILEGSVQGTKPYILENSAQNKILRRGQTDCFKYATRNLGKLEKCILGAVEREDKPLGDRPGREAQWHCHQVIVTDTSTGARYVFVCKDWITISDRISRRDGKELELKNVEESQVAIVRQLAPVKYEVVVITGDVPGAGTDANVAIILYGSNGETGKRPLKQRFRDLFEKNQTDKFQIEALDLGELTKLHIEHDNAGLGAGWFLERVEVINLATNSKTIFPCHQWLDRKKGDGEIARDLLPKID